MKRLSQTQLNALEDARIEINKGLDVLNAQIVEYNNVLLSLPDLGDARDDVQSAIEAFNEALADVVADAEAYADDRSERWQDSPKGLQYTDWIAGLTDLELYELDFDVEEPDQLAEVEVELEVIVESPDDA